MLKDNKKSLLLDLHALEVNDMRALGAADLFQRLTKQSEEEVSMLRRHVAVSYSAIDDKRESRLLLLLYKLTAAFRV
eukprot:752646-Hanusia_phi.AAC.1